MNDEKPAYDVFISYARQDGREYAEKLERELYDAGFKRIWRDKRNIDPTQDFTAEIEEGIEASKYVVTCISPDVKRKDSFVRREIQFALLCKKPIYVARFADVKPPIHVVNHTWLDFFKGWDAPFEQLCKLLKTTEYVVPEPEVSDPFEPYLEALYKQIVNYLDKTVFSSLPGMTNTPLLELTGDLTPEQVDSPKMIALNALPMAFWETAGVDVGAQHVAPLSEPYKNFHDAFNRYDGRVLLLGEPGGGKTTTLFAFARDKVAERLEQPDKPLPILVPIVTWNAEAQTPLAEWLAGAVTMLKDDVAGILREGKALLLLDGLDELGAEREDGKTKEKYDPRLRFMSAVQPLSPTLSPPAERGSKAAHAGNQMVVTCRVKDYEEIGAKLALQGAVTLKPLDDGQMKAYLRDLPELWKVLENDKELREVARIPLLLSFFAYAFTGLDEEAKALGSLSRGDVRDKIFETYIRRRYEWEERRAKMSRRKLSFLLEEIKETLSELAFESIIVFGQNAIFLTDEDFRRFNYINDLLVFSINLQILVLTEAKTYRFVHLLIRNHLAFPPTQKHLHSRNVRTRIRAAYAAGVLNDVRLVESLIELLNDNNLDVVWQASDVLIKLNDVRAINALITNLRNANPDVQLIIANSLKELNDTVTIKPLITEFKNLEIIESLIAALKEGSPTVKVVASTILGQLKEIRALEPLIFLLINNRDADVRHSVGDALVLFGEIAIKPLGELLKNADATLKRRIIHILGDMKNTGAITFLISALSDTDSMVRVRAAYGLGTLKDTRAIVPLIIALNDRDRLVRINAIYALKDIGTPEALTAVEKWEREQQNNA
jgi:HEAT repeat protein